MFKKCALLILTLALLLAACAPAGRSLSEPQFQPDVESAERGLAPEEAPAEDAAGGGFTAEIPQERLVIKNAELSIVATDPAETMESLETMAEEMGGFVVSSNLRQTQLTGGGTVDHASISMRVPAERLEEALDEIKAEASEVLSEDTSGEDVTREYTDLQSRLRNLESAEAQLTEIMEQASDTEDVLQVYNDLVQVREQIEVIKGQIQYYEQSAALSLISVDITADEAVQPISVGGWEPRGVAKDAIQALINALQWIGNALIWFGLCVLPVGLIALIPLSLIWWVARRVRERLKGEDEEEPQPPEEEA